MCSMFGAKVVLSAFTAFFLMYFIHKKNSNLVIVSNICNHGFCHTVTHVTPLYSPAPISVTSDYAFSVPNHIESR